ncbi:PREDICTED: alpha-glucan phosphorylase, H isozyme isoform X2 [Nelumbo nucifera]|uniref:Alpha-1,4 glucan phosphorylase n=1 Tax=Nelumbo nucifera TaxID=4432 RepID=A0A1U8Q3X3_NELNU|nr:PREDICTED: alpha-glucan phosphorylase, H isozyme isoform X2 [Nelumbo nucifera]
MATTTKTEGSVPGTAKVPAEAHPLAEESSKIASNISYHACYSPHFSPFKFDREQAYYATAESVRDRLIQQWNETYLHFHKVDPKQTYYLSMEYLQGRALTNAIGNLNIQNAYAEALVKLGHEMENIAEQICAVLYPGDTTENGKLLRLKQQYFLCSASLQDIIFRFKERREGKRAWKWSEFPNKVAVQLNDTHPTLAIPELMRILMDNEGLGWNEAWDITKRTIAYTNHTVLPEALEKWSQSVMQKLLPRHMEIIEEIDKRFMAMIRSTRMDLESKLPNMCILDNNPQKPVVRMANLCVVSSHTVNGVAQLHSDILKAELFADYVSIWPTKFQNKTNGITPRRWLRFCSPELSSIITKWLKTDRWITDLDLLSNLRQFADNEELHAEWASAKMANKRLLAQYVLQVTGVSIDPNSLFDIQVKRIHEYKRQLLNILGAVYRYKKLKEMNAEERKKTTARTIMFGGKAFATYTNAKRIVKLVNDVGAVVNNDPDVNKYLKVVFVPNYNVSVAEMLIPGSELSQHISTAGMEASGTSNMKFSLNGCIIIGTLDGANVEIREEIGEENFFLFGAKANEVPRLRKERENGLFKPDPRFEEAKQFIRSGAFGSYDYNLLLESLEGNSGYGRGDYFLVGQDFPSYMDAQARVDEAYKNRKRWLKMSILSTAGSGKFSSDRTIMQYAKEIWNIEACPVP